MVISLLKTEFDMTILGVIVTICNFSEWSFSFDSHPLEIIVCRGLATVGLFIYFVFFMSKSKTVGANPSTGVVCSPLVRVISSALNLNFRLVLLSS